MATSRGSNPAMLGQAYSFVPQGAAGALPPLGPLGSPYGAIVSNPYAAATPSPSAYAPQATPFRSGNSLYNPYAPTIVPPSGAYLMGAASVIDSQSQFMIARERAALMREDVKRSKLYTLRQTQEQRIWERNNLPTMQDDIERARAEELRRSRNNPTMAEVWSGKSLNDLLENAAKLQGQGMIGPALPLEDEVLKHINVSAGQGGNIGLLKNDGMLPWPPPLRTAPFSEPREGIDKLLPIVVKQAQFGPVDQGSLRDLDAQVKQLHAALSREVQNLPPTQYVEAKRFMKQVDDAVKALQQPNVTSFFTRKLSAKGKTVGELVKSMAGDGLRFAPATPGDEAAYAALHRALVTYEGALHGPQGGQPRQ